MTIESAASFRFARQWETLTAELGARLVMENRQELKGAVLTAIAGGTREIRIRFAPAESSTFIDSSGWGVLVGLARSTREAGARLVLVNVDQGNLDYLDLTRLSDFFTMERDDPGRIAA